jgi:hypothetical protein
MNVLSDIRLDTSDVVYSVFDLHCVFCHKEKGCRHKSKCNIEVLFK